jgi:hypothetical protein
MAMELLTGADFNLNQALNLVLQQLATDPISPAAGQLWFNTTSNQVKYYNGSGIIILWNSATTSAASTLVLRDSSANFAANVITAAMVTGLGSPSGSSDAVNLGYLQSVVNGQTWKDACRLATAASLPSYTYAAGVFTASSNGALTVDGVAVASGDRILVKNETTSSRNGIVVVTSTGSSGTPYVLTRAADNNTSALMAPGTTVPIDAGSSNQATVWLLTTQAPITLDTTGLTFTQIPTSASVSVNTPLALSGNTISLDLSARLANTGGNLDLASGVITPGTYSSVTFDTYGRATAGADLISGTGLAAKTASGTFTARSIVGTAGTITVSNGDGVSGNPTLTIDSSYAGQTSITTVGTLSSGTWQGTAVAVGYGGTGASTAAGARANLGAKGMYTALIGDGSSTTINIAQATHGLAASAALDATCWSASTGQKVYPDIYVNSSGQVSFIFAVAPSSNQYLIKIIG